jgi:hypothetical protein
MHPRVKRALRGGVVLAALSVFGVPAAAQACTQPATTQAFARFGDYADYWRAPGGGFETGAAGWELDNSAVVGANETFFVGGASDGQSLEIQPGGAAVSPAFCVDATNTTLRLFAKKSTGLTGTLSVELLYTTATGKYKARVGGVVAGTGAVWAGQVVKGDGSVQLRFVASQDAGAWAIDDVYIDPYRFA